MGNLVDEDVDDLLRLSVLHDGSLLRCLFTRYVRDVIYTNIGAIVVAMNPFTFDIPWYKDDKMAQYLSQGPRVSDELLPHTWACAHNTYYELVSDRCPQFILVSGESGSGKTEASKIVVRYLAAVSEKNAVTPEEKVRCTQCGHKLSQCSPILEAFGNARTVRNDNSSRFGKFMKIQFSQSFALAGSLTTRYLLEKSRVIVAAPGERVYHSFYLVLHSGSAMTKGYKLRADHEYQSASSGGILKNGDFDTHDDFEEVVAAMRVVGLSDVEVRAVWAVPAGILNLLNVEFEAHHQYEDAAQVKDCTSAFISEAAACWGVKKEVLHAELCETKMLIRGEMQMKRHSTAAARDVRDALCKALYDELFGWLVNKCNAMCDSGEEDGGWIGLLDIFGFEDFEKNSFEQLCINLANETLQGHYNTYVFARDMDECRAEGVSTVNIKCPDNTPCLNLIANPKTGIFALLDDQCNLGKGSDQGFVDEVLHAHTGHPDLLRHKFLKDVFSIRHYAGCVTYSAAGWLEKNRDTLKDDLKLLLRASTVPVVAALLPEPAPPDQRKRKVTVAGFFRQQLGELMTIINSSNPHWIRCIKPNPQKRPRVFDGITTTNQLESSGVLGTVKIRKAGYPVRIPFAKFLKRFELMFSREEERTECLRCISAGEADADAPSNVSFLRKLSEKLLRAAELLRDTASQVGKTRVFLKAEALTLLEAKRRQAMDAHCVQIQRAIRGLRDRKRLGVLRIKDAAILIIWEFRDYCARTASQREEKHRKLAILHAQASASASSLLHDAATCFAEVFATWQSQVLPAMVDAVEIEEKHARELTASLEGLAFTTLHLSVGSELVENGEAAVRNALAEEMFATLYYFKMDFCEEMQIELMRAEKRTRLRIEQEWRNALRGGDPSVAARLQTHLIAMERHGRELLLKRYADEGNYFIAEPFACIKLNALQSATGNSVGSTVAGEHPTSERQGRWLVMHEERSVREQLIRFRKLVAWRVLLLMTENGEARARSFIEERIEPRERSELARSFIQRIVELHTSRWVRKLVAAEAASRHDLAQIETDYRAFIRDEAVAEHASLERAQLEGEELVQRRTIGETQQLELRILVFSNIHAIPWNAEELVRLQEDEAGTRTEMLRWERSERAHLTIRNC